MPTRVRRAVELVILVGAAGLGVSCKSNLDCTAIGYTDEVRISLPAAMVDGRTTLRMCVDDQCNDEGQIKGLPPVVLEGTTLRLDLVQPDDTSPNKSTVRLTTTGAIPTDVSLKATWHVDHHGGCTDSRFIDLRFDEATKQLVQV